MKRPTTTLRPPLLLPLGLLLLLLLLLGGAAAAAASSSSSSSSPPPSFALVAGAVAERSDLSLLVEAVRATGLTRQFASPDLPATIFAPSDAAFLEAGERLGLGSGAGGGSGDGGASARPRLFLPEANRTLLLDILRFHVVPGTPPWSLQRLKDERPRLLTLLPGAESIEVGNEGGAAGGGGSGGGLTIRSSAWPASTSLEAAAARVVEGNVRAGQAVLHIIDRVLLPASIAEAVASARSSSSP
jgi:uncharacterized surface protein with fasciclin (FAS1) repeats